MEKDGYIAHESADYNGHGQPQYVDPATGIESKQGRIIEAAGLYGDIDTAEEYGYVTRGYVQRARPLYCEGSRNLHSSPPTA